MEICPIFCDSTYISLAEGPSSSLLSRQTSSIAKYALGNHHMQFVNNYCRNYTAQLPLLQELVDQRVGLLYGADNGSCRLRVNGAKLAEMPVVAFDPPAST